MKTLQVKLKQEYEPVQKPVAPAIRYHKYSFIRSCLKLTYVPWATLKAEKPLLEPYAYKDSTK